MIVSWYATSPLILGVLGKIKLWVFWVTYIFFRIYWYTITPPVETKLGRERREGLGRDDTAARPSSPLSFNRHCFANSLRTHSLGIK